jgi:hypothetical protein
VHRRAFLESLKERGLEVTRLVVSEDHAGLRRIRVATVFPNEAALLRDGFPEGDARGCAESKDRQVGRTVGTPGKIVRHHTA